MKNPAWLLSLPLALGGCLESRAPLDDFFGLGAIHRVEIELEKSSWEALLAEPRQYAPAHVWIDGTLCDQVGLRLKGAAGSFIPLDGERPWSGDGNGKPGKSAFIIDFNRYASGQNYLGLKKLTLNNMVQDPSSMHEFLGYALFRAGGIPASRCGFASVTLNGEEKYLYALVETPDNDEFLLRWFDTEGGDLFEGEYGADFYQDRIALLDHDHGTDMLRQGPLRAAEALDSVGEGQDPLPVLEQHFELEEYLTFAVTEIFLGHWDGYARSANNYSVFFHPGDGRFRFIPWGIDQLFVDGMGPHGGVMAGRGPSWSASGGRVHRECFRSAGCLSRLHDAFLGLLERVRVMDLAGLAERARDVVGPPTLQESELYGDPGRTLAAQDGILRFLEERPGAMEPWLPCLVGETVDQDRDGHDDCNADCRPEDPQVHPGAPERCNFRDDDCNCLVDDAPECEKCMDVPDGPYRICFEPRDWEQARLDCQQAGGDLASFTEPQRAMELAFQVGERGCLGYVWIGLRRAVGDEFAWSDGSPVGEMPLLDDAPGEGENTKDCVVVDPPLGWRPISCTERHPYTCKLPAP